MFEIEAWLVGSSYSYSATCGCWGSSVCWTYQGVANQVQVTEV